jgi:hypothetical protein
MHPRLFTTGQALSIQKMANDKGMSSEEFRASVKARKWEIFFESLKGISPRPNSPKYRIKKDRVAPWRENDEQVSEEQALALRDLGRGLGLLCRDFQVVAQDGRLNEFVDSLIIGMPEEVAVH